MDCTLVQSTKIGVAASAYGNSKQRGGSGVANVRMTSIPMQGGLRISLSRGFNAVDKFHSKVARAMTFDRFPDEPAFTGNCRFTDQGFEVVELAREEARQMGHNYIGTEQILLGVMAQGTGIAAKVLKSMGITLEDARVEVEKIIGKGNLPDEEIPMILPVLKQTPHVLEHTLDEADKRGYYVFSEHWLLGILGDDECVAMRVLKNLGADTNNIRTQVIQMIAEAAV